MNDYAKLAVHLDNLEFPEVIQIIKTIPDSKYNVLPHLTKVRSNLKTINPHNLCRCCRVETLILPYCTNLTDNVLVNLPYVRSLTVNSNSGLTEDIFHHLNYLEELQILSDYPEAADQILTSESVRQLSKLKYLHVYNNILTDNDIKQLKNLHVLVIDSTNPRLTPSVLNYLRHIEVCIINKILYKFISSVRNNTILKKIGKLRKIQIYAITNQ